MPYVISCSVLKNTVYVRSVAHDSTVTSSVITSTSRSGSVLAAVWYLQAKTTTAIRTREKKKLANYNFYIRTQ